MSTNTVRVKHNGETKTVALFTGLAPEELNDLLQAVFSFSGHVVGFLADNGLVVPISLACRAPETLPKSVCTLLVNSEASGATSSGLPAPPSKQGQVAAKPPPAPTAEDEEEQEDEEKDEQTRYVMGEILRFIAGLRTRRILSREEAESLQELLFDNGMLLFAAYSVAVSASDSEYFAEICRDIAQSLQSEEGRAACEAQDEVLQVCDQLYLASKLTENQLLYLRHLVLIREEAVASIYDDFQEHQSVPQLAKALYELANTHPYQSLQQEEGQRQEEEEDGDDGREGDSDDDDDDETEDMRLKRKVGRLTHLNGFLSSLLRDGQISVTEASILLDMLKNDNEYVTASYELFEADGDEEELHDTLMRCAKLEIRKRAAAVKEAQIEAEQQRREKLSADSKYKYDEAEDDSGDDDEDEDEEEEEDEESENESESDREQIDYKTWLRQKEQSAKVADAASAARQKAEEASEDGEGESQNHAASYLESVHLDPLLSVLGVKNVWQETVPKIFIAAVFVSAHRKQLSVGQARALCDLYEARYDLVRAAWEVFSVQGDLRDFIDTLLRIVRDMSFDDKGDVVNASGESKEAALRASASSSLSNTQSMAKASAERTAAALAATQAATKQEMDSRREAMAAVVAAKRELLKHSLEMMVKQGLATADGAASVFQRSLKGDPLVDAAIEAYASDKDVAEFLDTLQILCSHSSEEIDAILRSAAASSASMSSAADTFVAASGASPSKAAGAAASSSATATASKSPSKISVSTSTNTSPSKAAAAAAAASADASATSPHVKRSPLTKFAPSSPTASGSSTSGSPSKSLAASPSTHTYEPAQRELREIVLQLTKEEMTSPEDARRLLRLIHEKDSRVLAAYEVFKEVRDADDLIDTLTRIAAQEANNDSAGSFSFASAPEKGDFPKSNVATPGSSVRSDHGEEEEEGAEDGLLNADDQHTVVGILTRAGAVTESQASVLNDLISKGNAALRRIFIAYEKDKDVYKLIDSLKKMNIAKSPSKSSAPSPSASSTAAAKYDEEESVESDDDSENVADEDDGDDDEDEDAKDDRQSVEGRFASIVQNMKLSNLETAALRLAIARDDPGVRRALEVFREDLNEAKLCSALREVSRSTIENTLEERGYVMEGEDEDDEDDDEEEEGQGSDDDDDDDDDEEPVVQTRSPGYGRTTGGSPQKSSPAANRFAPQEDTESEESRDDDKDDDDDEDSEGNSSDDEADNDPDDDDDDEVPSSLKSSRDHVFPILISELVKESLMTSGDGSALLRLFAQGNEDITKALDAYDRDCDMAQLVETLQMVVVEQD